MLELKRSNFVYIYLADRRILDLQTFLTGEIQFSLEPQLTAVSVLAGTESNLSIAEVQILARATTDRWVAATELAQSASDFETCVALASKGLLLSTSDVPPCPAFRKREDALTSTQWNPAAAFYHFKAKQPHETGITDEENVIDLEAVATQSADNFAGFVSKHGPPPPPFHHRSGPESTADFLDLPLVERGGEFYNTLKNRRTIRAFDSQKPMCCDDLATVLYYAFGCHGYARLSKDVVAIKRTSPSGGCMHPIEVYPLLLNVSGVTPGLYHYNSFRHALHRLQQPETQDLAGLAVKIMGGQSFASSAHALLIMTARFERNFWKYRRNVKTYGIVLMDAGHLSQTGYLICSQLGLGAFFSAAINAPLLEQALGVDGIKEGAIGVFGCGEPGTSHEALGLDFEPFVPRKSEI